MALPEGLARLALLTLEHVAHQSYKGPVRSWAAKLALRYLHEHRGLSMERCENFWSIVTDPHCGQSTETTANNCRVTYAQTALHGIYRAMGVTVIEEAGLHMLGVTGRYHDAINGLAPLAVGYEAWQATDIEQRR